MQSNKNLMVIKTPVKQKAKNKNRKKKRTRDSPFKIECQNVYYKSNFTFHNSEFHVSDHQKSIWGMNLGTLNKNNWYHNNIIPSALLEMLCPWKSCYNMKFHNIKHIFYWHSYNKGSNENRFWMAEFHAMAEFSRTKCFPNVEEVRIQIGK